MNDYHKEHKEGNHAGGHESIKYTKVLGIRFHAFINFLGIPYQMSINSRAPLSDHLSMNQLIKNASLFLMTSDIRIDEIPDLSDEIIIINFFRLRSDSSKTQLFQRAHSA